MDTKTQFDTSPEQATDRRASIVLAAALATLVPLARWLVRNGVHYASFAPALKGVFIEAARRELHDADAKVTDSAISVLSGVHRRDIREATRTPITEPAPKSPSVASQVFTRWVTDRALRDAKGRPLVLPKSGSAPSFDSLAREMSSDVHPRTLLAEMLRLGLIEPEGDAVRLCTRAFLPQQGLAESAAMFSSNVADHMAAAVHNLAQDPAAGDGRFLEQSVFGSGLTPASIQALGETARALWAQAFEQIVREATQRYEGDRARPDAQMRMRFGVYYYAEPQAARAAPADPDPVAR